MNSKIQEAEKYMVFTRQLFFLEGLRAGFQRIKIMYF